MSTDRFDRPFAFVTYTLFSDSLLGRHRLSASLHLAWERLEACSLGTHAAWLACSEAEAAACRILQAVPHTPSCALLIQLTTTHPTPPRREAPYALQTSRNLSC